MQNKEKSFHNLRKHFIMEPNQESKTMEFSLIGNDLTTNNIL